MIVELSLLQHEAAQSSVLSRLWDSHHHEKAQELSVEVILPIMVVWAALVREGGPLHSLWLAASGNGIPRELGESGGPIRLK